MAKSGFSHLVEKFMEEEVIMSYMMRLTDAELKSLGITTMGSRIHFRDAASDWMGSRVPVQEDVSVSEDVAVSENVAVSEDVAVVVESNSCPDEHEEPRSTLEIEDHQLVFYARTLSTGRITHHFLDEFFRFDRNKVKPNGRAYFQCSVRGCSARSLIFK